MSAIVRHKAVEHFNRTSKFCISTLRATTKLEGYSTMPAFILTTSSVVQTTPRRHVLCRVDNDKVVRVSRRGFGSKAMNILSVIALSTVLNPDSAKSARPEGVNRPDLLPEEDTTVIDLERFLASGEIQRLKNKIADLEQRTGFKVRILTQRYPQSPGLAIRDYWGVNDDTVVIVADYFGGSGQLLKFNVGANVDKLLPPRFWSILSATYGNKFFVQNNSEAISIIDAVECVRTCLLKNGCVTPPDLNPKF